MSITAVFVATTRARLPSQFEVDGIRIVGMHAELLGELTEHACGWRWGLDSWVVLSVGVTHTSHGLFRSGTAQGAFFLQAESRIWSNTASATELVIPTVVRFDRVDGEVVQLPLVGEDRGAVRVRLRGHSTPSCRTPGWAGSRSPGRRTFARASRDDRRRPRASESSTRSTRPFEIRRRCERGRWICSAAGGPACCDQGAETRPEDAFESPSSRLSRVIR